MKPPKYLKEQKFSLSKHYLRESPDGIYGLWYE
jgi:hypothetical protein